MKKRAISDRPAWTVGSPSTVSGRLNKAGVSERKCRLYCAACCRVAQQHIEHDLCLKLLDVVEAWADDPEQAAEAGRLRRAVALWSNKIHRGAVSHQDWLARWSVWCAAAAKIVPPATGFIQPQTFRPLLAEVFGPELDRPACPPTWRTPDVLALATGIYADRMPLLADALMDAGCDDERVLAHCRGDGPHVRGCWVVDWVSGKE